MIRGSPWLNAASLMTFSAGMILLVYRTLINPYGDVDFKSVWVASYLWVNGLDPYADGFRQSANRLLPSGNIAIAWFYPPHWWILGQLIGRLSFPTALIGWRSITALSLVLSTLLVCKTLYGTGPSARYISLFYCGLVGFIEPTLNLVAFGQTSATIYIGLSLFIIGIYKKNFYCISACAFLLSLKVYTLIPIAIAMIFVRYCIAPLLVAAISAVLCSLPQFANYGFLSTINNWLGNLKNYGASSAQAGVGPNSAISVTGPLQLVARITEVSINPMIQIVPAMMIAAWSSRYLQSDKERERLIGISLIVSSLCAFIPFHIYDYSIAILAIVVISASANNPLFAAAIALLLIRPGRIEGLFKVPVYGYGVSSGTISLSIAGISLLLCATWRLWAEKTYGQKHL